MEDNSVVGNYLKESNSNLATGSCIDKAFKDTHGDATESVISSKNIYLDSGLGQQDSAACDVPKDERVITDDALLESVNKHMNKIKQFIEMDYVDCGKKENLDEFVVGETSAGINENIMMPEDDELSQDGSQCSEMIAGNVLVESEANDLCKLKKFERENVLLQLTSDKNLLNSEIPNLNSSDNGNDAQRYETNDGDAFVESIMSNDVNLCELKALENVGRKKLSLLSGEKILVNHKNEEEPVHVSYCNFVNDDISKSKSTNINYSDNEQYQKIQCTPEMNAVCVPESEKDNISLAKAYNKEIINTKNLNEISCEIVNGIDNSLQEEMNADVSNNKYGSDSQFCSDVRIKAIPGVKIVINKEALIEKISYTNRKVSPNNMDENCKGDNSVQKSVDDASKRTSISKILNEIQLSNLEKCVSNWKPDELHLDSEVKKQLENDVRDHEPSIDEDTICGIGSFKPQWLQKYATSECYMLLYSLIGIIQGTYYTFLISCISTLEKRFAFTSKISGAIMVVDEISPLFLGILVGYFGGKAHRPRIVALGMLLNVVSCFSMVLPYAIYGPAQHLDQLGQNKTTKLCDFQAEEEMCGTDDRPPTMAAVLILLFANFVKGFGNLAYYAVGLSYLDDNTKKKNTPFYLGIAMALRLFGPTLGFLLSSAFLKINENPFVDPGYGPDDPRWIGGWWVGFLAQGFILLIFTIPLALFPRRLPNQAKPPKSHYSDGLKWKNKFKGLVPAMKRLARNPLYVLILINTVMAILGGFGHYVMLLKYMENQFRLTASEASLYSGPPALTVYQIVTVVGGFLIWKFRPSAKFLTGGLALLGILSAIGFVILMIPKCPKVELSNVGLTLDGILNLQNQCNANCMCTTAAFSPVCGPDGRTTYFSPCHAGCTGSQLINDTQVYNNCSCVTDHTGNFITAQSLRKGFCVDEGCWNQALTYIIILPATAIFSILRVGHTIVLLRSIAPQDKSIALGAFETFICLFGFIPYPIIFGSLVDYACLVWEKSCGESGNCWFYDTDKFNYMLHGVSASFSFLEAICLIGIWYFSYRLPDLYEEEIEENEENLKKDNENSTETSTTKL